MRTTVPNQLPARSNGIALVGAFPGPTDWEKGMPLVGSAGGTLNVILRTANIHREDCWVGHLWPGMREPANPWEVKGRLLKPDLQEALASFTLPPEINVIVPLGELATYAFTGNLGFDNYRGTVQPATSLLPGMKVLPTVHPGDVRKVWKQFHVAVMDLTKAVREARSPLITVPEKRLVIEPTLADIEKWWAKYGSQSELLSVDIETGWGQITMIGFAADRVHGLCIPFLDLRQANRSYWRTPEEEIAAYKLAGMMLGSPIPKVGQNFGSYDLIWLLDRYHLPVRNYAEDTRLMQHAKFPEQPKSLAFLGAAYTEQGPWKGMTSHRKTTKRDDT